MNQPLQNPAWFLILTTTSSSYNVQIGCNPFLSLQHSNKYEGHLHSPTSSSSLAPPNVSQPFFSSSFTPFHWWLRENRISPICDTTRFGSLAFIFQKWIKKNFTSIKKPLVQPPLPSLHSLPLTHNAPKPAEWRWEWVVGWDYDWWQSSFCSVRLAINQRQWKEIEMGKKR